MLDLPREYLDELQGAPYSALPDLWDAIERHGRPSLDGYAWLGYHDRYYLLVRLLGRRDMLHPWVYARCREVEAAPDEHIDLWFREAGKSSVITIAGSIQEMIRDPEITIAIFSHTKPTARKFLKTIKRELEQNEALKKIYPDIFWEEPKKQAPSWSEDGGIIIQRHGNAKESTVEAHGLVDGQPTSAHFALRIYDDVVTLESVSTPEQIRKTTEAWELSDNLGARNPITGLSRRWHIGTRYSFGDSYADILERGILKQRIYPATDNGHPDGTPVLLSPQAWAEKKRTMSSAILAAQMLQNPTAGGTTTFKKEWLRFSDVRPATLNVYIMCDPASARKNKIGAQRDLTKRDRTAMLVVGIDAQRNRWVLDGYCHRMSLSERWTAFSGLRRYWRAMPGVQSVKLGYERYGSESDFEHFEEQMARSGDVFDIVELATPHEGPGSKPARIERLEPDFRAGIVYFARVVEAETKLQRQMREQGFGFRVFVPVRRRDENNELYSLNKRIIEEYIPYPYSARDDALDCLSRIYDMDVTPPVMIESSTLEPETFVDGI